MYSFSTKDITHHDVEITTVVEATEDVVITAEDLTTITAAGLRHHTEKTKYTPSLKRGWEGGSENCKQRKRMYYITNN